MNKEEKLYVNLTNSLYNIIKKDKFQFHLLHLKSFISGFNNMLNYLFWLEKKHNTKLNDSFFAIAMAQKLTNISQQKITLELLSDINFEIIEEGYVEFLDFIVKEFKTTKVYLKKIKEDLSLEDIKKIKKISNDNFEKIKNELKDQKENSNKTNNSNKKVSQTAPVFIPPAGNNANPNNFNPNQFNAQFQNMMGQMPNHPNADERFYPYTHKHTWMPKYKNVFSALIAISCFLVFIVSLIAYLSKVNYGQWWIDNNSNQILPYQNAKGAFTGYTLKTVKLPLIVSNFTFYISFASLFLGSFFAYKLFNGNQKIRDKYVIHKTGLIFSIIIIGIDLYISITFLMPSAFKSYIKNFFPQKATSSWPSGSVPTDWSGELNKIADYFYNIASKTSIFKALSSLYIVAIVFTGLSLIGTIFGLVTNPRYDKAKIMKAHAEYQKAVYAKMQNQEYEIDPSIYDKDLIKELEKQKKEEEKREKEEKENIEQQE